MNIPAVLSHWHRMETRFGQAMSKRRKMELIDSEVRSFYEYCNKAGFTEEEMDAICKPLANAERRASMQKWLRIAAVSIVLISLVYILSNQESCVWHASAIGRLVMIRLLPFWDWTRFFYKPKSCLIEKQGFEIVHEDRYFLTLSDCAVCETIETVDRVSDTDFDSIQSQYLIRGAPVIITDAYNEWSSTKDPGLNLTHLLANDERLGDSIPCVLESNLRTGRQPTELHYLLTTITNTKIPRWFIHFQNCDIEAVKSLRVLAPRPYFLSPHIRPAHFNWLLMSKRYAAPKSKYLELDVGLIVLSQLRGSNVVTLRPRSPCEGTCGVVAFEVSQGETLVLENSIWEFEYLPDDSGENVAILTETSIEDD